MKKTIQSLLVIIVLSIVILSPNTGVYIKANSEPTETEVQKEELTEDERIAQEKKEVDDAEIEIDTKIKIWKEHQDQIRADSLDRFFNGSRELTPEEKIAESEKVLQEDLDVQVARIEYEKKLKTWKDSVSQQKINKRQINEEKRPQEENNNAEDKSRFRIVTLRVLIAAFILISFLLFRYIDKNKNNIYRDEILVKVSGFSLIVIVFFILIIF